MNQDLKSRKDIPVELTWDLSLIYASEDEMRQDAEKVKHICERMVKEYKGKLDTAVRINACLDDFREVDRLLTLVAVSYPLLRAHGTSVKGDGRVVI